MKKITPKQKKILDIVVTVLQVALVVVAITISAIVIANPVITTNEVSKGQTKLLPVKTNSMDGTAKDSFAEGDLIIAKKPKDALSLEKGQIVTFVGTVNGSEALITHRIVEIVTEEDGTTLRYYVTRGDNNPENMTEAVNPNKVLAVYSSHLDGVGSAILWLQTPTNFLLVIVLPLVLLFVYNIIMFVRMIMQAKVDKVKEAAAGTGSVAVDEEEIKRKAIEEYLASQKKEDSSPDKE